MFSILHIYERCEEDISGSYLGFIRKYRNVYTFVSGETLTSIVCQTFYNKIASALGISLMSKDKQTLSDVILKLIDENTEFSLSKNPLINELTKKLPNTELPHCLRKRAGILYLNRRDIIETHEFFQCCDRNVFDDFSILGYTNGRMNYDNIEFMPDYSVIEGQCFVTMLHKPNVETLKTLSLGDRLYYDTTMKSIFIYQKECDNDIVYVGGILKAHYGFFECAKNSNLSMIITVHDLYVGNTKSFIYIKVVLESCI